jgi:hypothetical protein
MIYPKIFSSMSGDWAGGCQILSENSNQFVGHLYGHHNSSGNCAFKCWSLLSSKNFSHVWSGNDKCNQDGSSQIHDIERSVDPSFRNIVRIRNLNWGGWGLDRLHLILHDVREIFRRYGLIPKL